MVDRSRRALTMIVRLRRAQCDAARGALLAADRDVARASEVEAGKSAERDDAEEGWRDLIEVPQIDPGLARRAGEWLVACERALSAARLDREIATNRRDVLGGEWARARGCLDAAAQVSAARARAVVKRREQARLAQAADLFLQGWRA